MSVLKHDKHTEPPALDPQVREVLIDRHQRRHGQFDPDALAELESLLSANPDTARILALLEKVKGE